MKIDLEQLHAIAVKLKAVKSRNPDADVYLDTESQTIHAVVDLE